jgi:predicted hotdog family 3-hydroxylacyl-ACP dehydratase
MTSLSETFPPVGDLVPHGGPMLLIDHLIAADDLSLRSSVTITTQSRFFTPGLGVPAYVGIEYIAQSISAYSGWRTKRNAANGEGSTAPKIGYLLGTRKMTLDCDYFPENAVLEIVVTNIFEDGEMGVFDGEIRLGDQIVVTARVNVYQPNDMNQPRETSSDQSAAQQTAKTATTP